MTRLDWLSNNNRTFETGLDRGVLYPKDDTAAVPWNGLISVDEDGQETAATYYIDGRPFLFVPKPKEFSATLKAYTYPDEFTPMMGVEELVDGMYIDSQQASSFDLSYRTLIGGSDGATAGYKIHLIYNCVVTMEGVGYESMSESLSLTELSWLIQAVPVEVPNRRATAHIIIDTRHMDKEKLYRIEALLYGTPAADAKMPSPTAIFDILSFNGAIIITDNGDDTWTIEASQDVLKEFNDGTFQLTTPNYRNTGSGTYRIWSTGESEASDGSGGITEFIEPEI